MTVSELIAYLEKLPKDTVIGVVFTACSDLCVLEESDLRIYPAFDGSGKGWPKYVIKHGQLMEYNPNTWDPAVAPVFVPVLAFPGN